MFTSQWGRLMESLVRGDLVPLLQQRGIAVEMTTQRVAASRNGEHFEVDILAANGTEAVAVEVKTTLRPRDVKRFEAKLARFGEWLPAYSGHRLYGAVAYLEADESVVRHAERRGLFVIRATGSKRQHREPAGLRAPPLRAGRRYLTRIEASLPPALHAHFSIGKRCLHRVPMPGAASAFRPCQKGGWSARSVRDGDAASLEALRAKSGITLGVVR